MNLTCKIAVAAAAILIVAVVGYNLLPGFVDGRRRAGRDAKPSATPIATPAPTPAPSGNPGGRRRRRGRSHSGRRAHAAGLLRHSPVAGAG